MQKFLFVALVVFIVTNLLTEVDTKVTTEDAVCDNNHTIMGADSMWVGGNVISYRRVKQDSLHIYNIPQGVTCFVTKNSHYVSKRAWIITLMEN